MKMRTRRGSIGPCSEEGKAALTDETILSLWYGGVNKVYVRRFRSAGRWFFCPAQETNTSREFTRIWASDNPYLRVFVYYCKAVWGILGIASAALFLGNWYLVNYVQDFEHTFARDSFGVSFYVFMVVFILLGIPHLMLSLDVYSQWMPQCRALSRALREGWDPDLCDRARMGEMRRTILGWAWNSGYVRYDREKGWRLNAPSRGSKGGRLIE